MASPRKDNNIPEFLDVKGTKYGRLEALERDLDKSKPGVTYWKCVCECGNIISVNLGKLRNSHTRSCGCLYKDMIKDRTESLKSKLPFNTKIRKIWNAEKRRCFNESDPDYHHYGGRGITMCSLWVQDYRIYYDYVMSLPNACDNGFSIDRINNDGNYEPGNVRWATQKTQRENSRGTKLTKESASIIRGLWHGGKNTKQELSTMFDVSVDYISKIINSKAWKE